MTDNIKRQPIREDETRTILKIAQELVCITATSLLIAIDFFYLCWYFNHSNFVYVALTVMCGWLVADFLSGLFHWLGDSYGSIETPGVGKHYIQPLRIHHVVPTAFTFHDILVTNGDNFMLGIIPLSLAIHQFHTCPSDEIDQIYLFEVFRFIVSLGACFQNQCHKWAHMYNGLPKLVILLQELHLILPRQHHRFHHVSPHIKRFCIINGLLNYPLDKFKFWSKLENIIEFTTGIQARTDDMEWAYE